MQTGANKIIPQYICSPWKDWPSDSTADTSGRPEIKLTLQKYAKQNFDVPHSEAPVMLSWVSALHYTATEEVPWDLCFCGSCSCFRLCSKSWYDPSSFSSSLQCVHFNMFLACLYVFHSLLFLLSWFFPVLPWKCLNNCIKSLCDCFLQHPSNSLLSSHPTICLYIFWHTYVNEQMQVRGRMSVILYVDT
jgi:hypothetical protein